MNKKISNDENIRNLKKRKILRAFIIIFCILTIILAFLNLFYDVSIFFAIGTFVIVIILNKTRDNIFINKRDDLEEIREEIKKIKKR